MVPPKSHPAYGAVRKPPQELENKKMARIATFLRLRIVAWFQIASRGVKTRIIGHKTAYFRFAGAGGSPLSKKSCKDARIFVFAFTQGLSLPIVQRLGIIFVFSTVAMACARKLDTLRESAACTGARSCCMQCACPMFVESASGARGSAACSCVQRACAPFAAHGALRTCLLLRAAGVRLCLACDGCAAPLGL